MDNARSSNKRSSKPINKGPSAQGKVRDIYDLGDRLLLVATDRVSAYDLVLPSLIPDKGRVLTALSVFWFSRTQGLANNHFISDKIKDFPDVGLDESYLNGRALLVKKAEVIPFECVVRGYLAGSAWSEYLSSGTVAGQVLPEGLVESQKFDQALFTPSTKAADGHDENISYGELEEAIGEPLARKLRLGSLNLFSFASNFAAIRGLIIADTKFEFGFVDGELTLIDEVLTPDSSRFWPMDTYTLGRSQPSFDKQFVRDWLDESGWDHKPPAPELPESIIKRTSAKYIEAYERLTGDAWLVPQESEERV
ncbi:MAG TPA: phosphoribosylaminoimidazolesuccinocarboxamide synthase [Actinobacteria bacterium]|nr:phosphoribosylaminoimidazolesuccinocarboxamide synthase [Actinomycetota bacterium]